ncbi:hypothetical protein G7066_13425 [Leucobacter coleopterorum]|uniref:Ig-like domain-containing protein n=1 Tax=Leucobacter coleopterorum TaxID=2714933 RepID=A0ABX6JYM9_9MICO|nr:hypothetical protein [Leucobacter coleopterorum]QIM19323.1 hypothetical protein G7066_13425 [Leucobacter coleopterorum]
MLGNGKVVIEEYNYGWGGAYHYRVVDSRDFEGYIHIKDIVSSFSKTPAPVLVGQAVVGEKLTANVEGWRPAPTSLRYQWKRDGDAIKGASHKSYEPALADRGSSLSVEITASRAGYRAVTKVVVQSDRVLFSDTNRNGIEDSRERAESRIGLEDYGRAAESSFSDSGISAFANSGIVLFGMRDFYSLGE